jgi:hypothetical protein
MTERLFVKYKFIPGSDDVVPIEEVRGTILRRLTPRSANTPGSDDWLVPAEEAQATILRQVDEWTRATGDRGPWVAMMRRFVLDSSAAARQHASRADGTDQTKKNAEARQKRLSGVLSRAYRAALTSRHRCIGVKRLRAALTKLPDDDSELQGLPKDHLSHADITDQDLRNFLTATKRNENEEQGD